MNSPRIDLTGQRFERLIVIRETGRNKYQNVQWLCRCDCGNDKITITKLLRSGETRSCGCLQRDHVKSGIAGKTHGLYHTPEYLVWQNMMKRCYDPNHMYFYCYGGRGITVCAHWHKVKNFVADIGRRPSPKHSIERKNNDGNYNPDNCQWATAEEQSRNKRNSIVIEHQGESHTIPEWSKITGINRITLYWRYHHNYPLEHLFSRPIHGGAINQRLLSSSFKQ